MRGVHLEVLTEDVEGLLRAGEGVEVAGDRERARAGSSGTSSRARRLHASAALLITVIAELGGAAAHQLVEVRAHPGRALGQDEGALQRGDGALFAAEGDLGRGELPERVDALRGEAHQRARGLGGLGGAAFLRLRAGEDEEEILILRAGAQHRLSIAHDVVGDRGARR